MTTRKIVFASPVEPSGASWLINCFLELGIKVNHKPIVRNIWRAMGPDVDPSRMWEKTGDSYSLNPRADIIKKWVPAFTHHDKFTFSTDVEVEYVQDFPTPALAGYPTIFFVRDPRDAIYSMYRRTATNLSFREFVLFLNPDTLLSRVDHWRMYVHCWLSGKNTRTYRFEDYKQDDRKLLAGILNDLDLRFSDAEVDRAVVASSLDQAKSAEAQFKKQYPDDWEVANRAGKVGDWRHREDIQDCIQLIESRTCKLLKMLGYDSASDEDGHEQICPALHIKALTFFQQILLPKDMEEIILQTSFAPQDSSEVEKFAQALNESKLRDSRLSPARIRQLLDSLSIYLKSGSVPAPDHLESLRQLFAEGSSHHFDRIRELRARRKRTERLYDKQ